ncbi:MAG: hybrid sensor histidine kinase/response regulator [Snowella sp.]|jgi:CheY-like chemotaxis protein|nr:MAG: hybrid sensor histidine kinase/response regulator [Snowella sp.]
MNPPSILIVDDEPNNFDVIETLLSVQGYQLYYASNGQEALSILDTVNPDLILLDVMMPGLNGIDVCKKIKADLQWKIVPIIMVTALSSKEDLALCLEAGADDFISKPVNRLELCARVKSMLRIKQQHDTIQHFSDLQRNTINVLGRNLQELTGNLVLSLSQELNTPVNGISSIIELLKVNIKNMDTVEVQLLLDLADQSAHRLEDVTNRFLLYLELELASLQPQSKPIEETYLPVATIQARLKSQAAKVNRKDDLVFDLQEIGVRLSKRYFLVILQELVDNALKFSQTGTKITIQSQVINGMLEISVHDQGRGMTKQQIAKVGAFMQFERPNQEQSGTGLGLAIIKKIVEGAKGKLTITSIYEKETTVNVSVPIKFV